MNIQPHDQLVQNLTNQIKLRLKNKKCHLSSEVNSEQGSAGLNMWDGSLPG